MANEPPKGRVFLGRVYPAVEAALVRPEVARRIQRHLHNVIGSSRLMKSLEATHPGETVYFGDKESNADQAPIYEMLGVVPVDVRKAIKDTGVVRASWQHANKPLYWVLMAVIRAAARARDVELTKTAVLFMSVAMYAGLQFRYFRRFYQPNAMAYAMNTLTDKFTLKQEGTMLKAIMTIAWRCHEKYAADLEGGADLDLLKYLVSMWGRLNGMVKALKNHYELTKVAGKYLNQSKDQHDDGSMVERDTDGGRVQTIADRVSEAFFGEPMPSRIVDIAAQMTDVPRQSLTLAVTEIRGGDTDPLRELVSLIAELFFEEQQAGLEDVKTRSFLAFCNSIYTRSNTKDGRVERIKQLLNDMLVKHSVQYLRTNREATKGAFRKAMYLIVILYMQTKA